MTILTNSVHLIDPRSPIEWNGNLYIINIGSMGIGAGGLVVNLESKCYNGEKAKGKYLLFLSGFSKGLPVISFSFSSAKVTMYTPGFFGVNPYWLQGTSTWTSASYVVQVPDNEFWQKSRENIAGYQSSITSLYISMGFAKVEFPFWAAEWGFDIGFDFFGGVSIGLPGTMQKNIPCAN